MSAIFIAYLLKFDLSLFMALQTSACNMQMRRGSKIEDVNVTISLLGLKTNLFRYFLNIGTFCLMRITFKNFFFRDQLRQWVWYCARILSVYSVVYHRFQKWILYGWELITRGKWVGSGLVTFAERHISARYGILWILSESEFRLYQHINEGEIVNTLWFIVIYGRQHGLLYVYL